MEERLARLDILTDAQNNAESILKIMFEGLGYSCDIKFKDE